MSLFHWIYGETARVPLVSLEVLAIPSEVSTEGRAGRTIVATAALRASSGCDSRNW